MAELDDAIVGADVTVNLTGGHQAVLDGDPPWGFLTGLSKVTSPDPKVAAEALDYLNNALPSMVRSWTLPSKVAGSSWQAGEVPPATNEGLLSISTRLVVELALKYGQSFSQIPKAPAGLPPASS